jgi:hypothetical protein
MKPEEQPVDALDKCELCEQRANPTLNVYKTHTCLCSACLHQIQILPDLVANNLSRFLIGNVI